MAGALFTYASCVLCDLRDFGSSGNLHRARRDAKVEWRRSPPRHFALLRDSWLTHCIAKNRDDRKTTTLGPRCYRHDWCRCRVCNRHALSRERSGTTHSSSIRSRDPGDPRMRRVVREGHGHESPGAPRRHRQGRAARRERAVWPSRQGRLSWENGGRCRHLARHARDDSAMASALGGLSARAKLGARAYRDAIVPAFAERLCTSDGNEHRIRGHDPLWGPFHGRTRPRACTFAGWRSLARESLTEPPRGHGESDSPRQNPSLDGHKNLPPHT